MPPKEQIIDKSFNIDCVDETTSTNSDLKTLALSGKFNLPPGKIGQVLVADYQTQGKGRQGRHWYSKPGHSLLMSLLLKTDFWVSKKTTGQKTTGQKTAEENQRGLHFINTCFALSALKSCQSFSHGEETLQMKWPNYLVVFNHSTREHKKLAGILSELIQGFLVIGIGINLETPDVEETKGRLSLQPIGLNELAAKQVPRDDLLKRILQEFGGIFLDLQEMLKEQQQKDFWNSEFYSSIQKEVLSNSALLGEEVEVHSAGENQKVVSGRVEGFTDMGHLILETETGRLELLAGDVAKIRA